MLGRVDARAFVEVLGREEVERGAGDVDPQAVGGADERWGGDVYDVEYVVLSHMERVRLGRIGDWMKLTHAVVRFVVTEDDRGDLRAGRLGQQNQTGRKS